MRRKARVRQLVDGELDPAEMAALEAKARRDPDLAREIEDAREVVRALRSLEAPEPPADLVDRAVLRAVQLRARAEEQPSRLGWLRPRTLRIRLTPTLALTGLTALVLIAVWFGRASEPSPSPPSTSSVQAQQALVRFVVPAEGAATVAVAGDFNDWRTDELFLEDPEGDGVFVGTLRLRPGSYAYMFVIDGERWVTDPYAVNHRDDGFGNRNAILRID